MSASQNNPSRPLICVTGAAGKIGTALTRELRKTYFVVGFDRDPSPETDAYYDMDVTSDASIELALRKATEEFGKDIAAVIHLAAYFDFTGEENPLYESVNETGTKQLLKELQNYNVDRFIYSGTMLVHKAGVPGERISEETEIDPSWAYPKSKAKTEEIISKHRGEIAVSRLHLAGLYDDETAVPTLSNQIARIYEKTFKSYVYSGDENAGQSFIHKDDLVDAFAKVVENRFDLPQDHALLIGEPDAISYQHLQSEITQLIHGTEHVVLANIPKPMAKIGASVEEHMEPVIPDDIDQGEKPFIRSFMIDMASDHYALDIYQARKQLGWEPKNRIIDKLPILIDNLKKDPLAWYNANKITAPRWIQMAEEKEKDAERLREHHDELIHNRHRQFLWAPFFNLFAASWLLTFPLFTRYDNPWLEISDVVSGLLVFGLGLLTLSRRAQMFRWLIAAIGVWVMFAPLVFWTSNSAVYLNGTLIGTLIFAFAVLSRPTPGVSRIALETGPDRPPGWDFNPSAWLQRLPIIVLAVIGLHISRYLTAYQLGHIDEVWEPFFAGLPNNAQNGTEEIITSSVSEAWPVPDAGIGALTYMLEILTGVIGSTRRWRTMPWLVLLFGLMIVPLGIVSITFIIIQPILLGTWCTLCLIAAAAMLIQIPYSLDELVATGAFLRRRQKAGAPILRILFTGDTDDGQPETKKTGEFDRPVPEMLKDFAAGGITLPYNLALVILIGISLMFTRITFDATGAMANFDHLVGSLVVTVTVIALAESGRTLRFLNIVLGGTLIVATLVYAPSTLHLLANITAGLALMLLSLRKGPIQNNYGIWTKFIK